MKRKKIFICLIEIHIFHSCSACFSDLSCLDQCLHRPCLLNSKLSLPTRTLWREKNDITHSHPHSFSYPDGHTEEMRDVTIFAIQPCPLPVTQVWSSPDWFILWCCLSSLIWFVYPFACCLSVCPGGLSWAVTCDALHVQTITTSSSWLTPVGVLGDLLPLFFGSSQSHLTSNLS